MLCCKRLCSIVAAMLFIGLCSGTGLGPAAAEAPLAAGPGAPQTGSFLLTIFLRHDQAKTVDPINEHLRQTG